MVSDTTIYNAPDTGLWINEFREFCVFGGAALSEGEKELGLLSMFT